jgi:hypothetical protein
VEKFFPWSSLGRRRHTLLIYILWCRLELKRKFSFTYFREYFLFILYIFVKTKVFAKFRIIFAFRENFKKHFRFNPSVDLSFRQLQYSLFWRYRSQRNPCWCEVFPSNQNSLEICTSDFFLICQYTLHVDRVVFFVIVSRTNAKGFCHEILHLFFHPRKVSYPLIRIRKSKWSKYLTSKPIPCCSLRRVFLPTSTDFSIDGKMYSFLSVCVIHNLHSCR